MKCSVNVHSGTSLSKGTLTDEHSASSYGIPVLVVNGQAYGPGDLPIGTEIKVRKATMATNLLVKKAIKAGYPIVES